jgi:rhodanese-related sulfurtransferase
MLTEQSFKPWPMEKQLHPLQEGGRFMQALQFLRQKGFQHVKSVKGGIDAWSMEIDPGVPSY